MKKKFFLWIIFIICVCMLITTVNNCIFDESGICALHINSSSPPNGCKDIPYLFQFTAGCGKKPFTWNTASGTKPPGLKLDPKSGVLSGKPTLEGDFSFYIEVTDSDNDNYLQEYKISIKEFNITDSDQYILYCPGEALNHNINTCGGDTPFIWTIKSGSLPTGIKIEQDGRIAGTTSATGKFTFTVQVEDKNGKKAEKEYILYSISGMFIQSKHPLPQGQVSKPYPVYKFQALCGQPPFIWSNPDGILKTIGLSLSATTGELSGTPKSDGNFKFEVAVKDSTIPKPNKNKNNFYITIIPPPLAITSTSPLKDAIECTPYTFQFTASGGMKKYTWSNPDGVLKKIGLILDPTSGKLYGKPEIPQATPYSFNIQVLDIVESISTSKTFTLKVLEDNYVTPKLAILAVYHNYLPGGSTRISLSEKTKTAKILFHFPSDPNLLQYPAASARLQVVGGDCSHITNTGSITLFDRDNDGKHDSRLAHFNPQLVATMLIIANKKPGDTASLRFWIDVTEDKKSITFIQKIKIDIIQ